MNTIVNTEINTQSLLYSRKPHEPTSLYWTQHPVHSRISTLLTSFSRKYPAKLVRVLGISVRVRRESEIQNVCNISSRSFLHIKRTVYLVVVGMFIYCTNMMVFFIRLPMLIMIWHNITIYIWRTIKDWKMRILILIAHKRIYSTCMSTMILNYYTYNAQMIFIMILGGFLSLSIVTRPK